MTDFFRYLAVNPGQTFVFLGTMLTVFAGFYVTYSQNREQIKQKNEIWLVPMNLAGPVPIKFAG